MNVAKIRIIVKSFVKIDTLPYTILKNIYYVIKIALDFLLLKISNPNAKWIYSYGNKKAKLSHSQYGQDLYILDKIGKDKSYVEVGANHPVRLNNTFLLESNGWSGVSIDPLNKYLNEWIEIREQPLINCAIGSIKISRVFVEFFGEDSWYDMMSGFKEFVREEDLLTFKSKEYNVEVLPLNEVIPFDSFELLLIDTEGAEMEVLKGIDLQVYKPKHVMLENAAEIGGGRILRTYMYEQGYKLIARIGCADDFFELK